MHVPPDTPHAFADDSDAPVTTSFRSSVAGGHEDCFRELGEPLAASHGSPEPSAVHDLEARYGTEQLTAMKV